MACIGGDRRDEYNIFSGETRRGESDDLDDLVVDGRIIIIIWTFKTWDGGLL